MEYAGAGGGKKAGEIKNKKAEFARLIGEYSVLNFMGDRKKCKEFEKSMTEIIRVLALMADNKGIGAFLRLQKFKIWFITGDAEAVKYISKLQKDLAQKTL